MPRSTYLKPCVLILSNEVAICILVSGDFTSHVLFQNYFCTMCTGRKGTNVHYVVFLTRLESPENEDSSCEVTGITR